MYMFDVQGKAAVKDPLESCLKKLADALVKKAQRHQLYHVQLSQQSFVQCVRLTQVRK